MLNNFTMYYLRGGMLTAGLVLVMSATSQARDAPPLPAMVSVPGGAFMMGSLSGEPGREGDEAPRHRVTLARHLYISRYEVTEAEWNACVADGSCPALPQQLGARFPARVSWEDAHVYLDWLGKKTGQPYRLLSEAEWEYAARAGTATPYPSGTDITAADANIALSRKEAPVAVGAYRPNAFGLYDMIGNVWEWVEDCYHAGGYYDALADGLPIARTPCHAHVVRGGSFQTRPGQARVAYRYRPLGAYTDVGLRVAYDAPAPGAAPAPEQAFHPGQPWVDDKGVTINAHGGGILLHKGRYYWYGEHKTEGEAGNTAQVGVHVYSSHNLYDWNDEGIGLAVSSDPAHELVRGSVIERPKVIYNPKTGKFVMWFHLEFKGLGYKSARAGVAVADRPTGPFVYRGSSRPNAGAWPLNVGTAERDPASNVAARDHDTGQMARDMTLFVDDDGAAYHIYASEENHTLQVSRLSDDYTRDTGKYARVAPGGDNEAPAVFKSGGKYYMFTSGLTGWTPNAARSFVADSMYGPWTSLGNPVRGTEQEGATTFGGQSTHVFPYRGSFIFMADIWHPANPIGGRYAWLPVEWEDGRPVIRWHTSWSAPALPAPVTRPRK